MCNTCNTGYTTMPTSSYYSHQGCGCGCPCLYGLLSWLFGGCCGYQRQTQSVCRDACGNLRITNGNNCARSCGCGCASQTATANSNASFGCYTFCGRVGNGVATPTVSADNYYARQYGLNSCGATYNSCGCGCN